MIAIEPRTTSAMPAIRSVREERCQPGTQGLREFRARQELASHGVPPFWHERLIHRP